VIVISGYLPVAAFGSDLTTDPTLRLEIGMHAGPIMRIDVDKSERFIVTGSHDKTVRVWDLSSGQLVRTIYVPQGEGHLGKIYAVAISPDGETIAAGGY